MKKRKSPILLITLLVICLGAVVAMNYKPSKGGDGHDHQAEAPQASEGAQPGQPRTNSPSVADLAKNANKAATPPPQAMNPMMKANKMGMPEDAIPASIEDRSQTIEKPKPNDSSIAGQWYAEGARK